MTFKATLATIALAVLASACARPITYTDFRVLEERATLGAAIVATDREICGLSPLQRDALARSVWEREKNKPGSPYASYGHIRADMRHVSGC